MHETTPSASHAPSGRGSIGRVLIFVFVVVGGGINGYYFTIGGLPLFTIEWGHALIAGVAAALLAFTILSILAVTSPPSARWEKPTWSKKPLTLSDLAQDFFAVSLGVIFGAFVGLATVLLGSVETRFSLPRALALLSVGVGIWIGALACRLAFAWRFPPRKSKES